MRRSSWLICMAEHCADAKGGLSGMRYGVIQA